MSAANVAEISLKIMDKKNSSDFIDIKGLFLKYAKNWYWFAISVVICCMGAYVVVKKFPQKSQVNASILVTQDDGTASMLNGLGGLLGADPYVQDEIFVITSHSVLKDVVRDLGINKMHWLKTGFLTKKLEYPDFPVDVFATPQLTDTLSAVLNFKVVVSKDGKKADITVKAKGKTIADIENAQLPANVSTIYGDYIVNKTETFPTAADEEVTTWITFTGYDSAAEDLAKEIDAYIASKKSNVIQLGVQTANAVYGCDMLNKTMAVYNERGIQERNERALKTASFIQERLALISDALDEAENAIESYKEGNRMVDVGIETSINTRLKTEYEAKLVELRTNKEILDMTLNFLMNGEKRYELLPVVSLDGDSENTALQTYNELVLKRMTMLSGAKSGNRNVVEIEKQIDALRENIIVAIERAIESCNVAIKDAKLQADMAIAKLGNVPTQEREFLNLKRQQQVKQQLYIFLLERSEETAMLIANAIPKGTVIDAAYVLRDPVGAGKFLILIIAIFIGLFIPIFVLYIIDMLRSRMEGRTDVEKITGLPILGEMCLDKSGNNLVVSEKSTSSSSELFRMIRTNLEFVLGNPGDKVVMVTSSMSGEGKSFISTNVAASLALLGKKVVLVGMDIRKPQLANYLGVSPSPGLTQYLSNSSMPLEDIIRDYEPVPGLSLIVAGPIPPNPGELMTSSRIGELIAELRREFDYIIVDTSPVGMVSDSFNLTKYVDATIFVVFDKRTRLQDLRFLNSIAEDKRLKRVNVIINGTHSKKGYGYGYK